MHLAAVCVRVPSRMLFLSDTRRVLSLPATDIVCLAVVIRLQVVYPDAYRLRLLNGCNSRTLQLRFAT